jgi:hypothetical protein
MLYAHKISEHIEKVIKKGMNDVTVKEDVN